MAEFTAFVEATGRAMTATSGLNRTFKNPGFRNPGFTQTARHPVVCVSWLDAIEYAQWLSERSEKPYRLLSEAQWEYAARAGTTTPFWCGHSITPKQANYDDRQQTVPVDSFEPNPWGLYQVHGNTFEWCEDLWHDTYKSAPLDGSAWVEGGNTDRAVQRGGSWINNSWHLRSAARSWVPPLERDMCEGFRIARSL